MGQQVEKRNFYMSLFRKKRKKTNRQAQEFFDILDDLNLQWINEPGKQEALDNFCALLSMQAMVDPEVKEAVIEKSILLSKSTNRYDRIKAFALLMSFTAFEDDDPRVVETFDSIKKNAHDIFLKT